jgi:hypothetical protein
MITQDALRSALLSDQPWTRLDELVRAELAGGRLVNQIFDELLAMEDAVRESPGFDEDAEDAFRDTLDALNGFCKSEYAYRNPPVPPSQEEIERLPHYARVAVAGRWVRRVEPLFAHFWPTAPEELVSSVKDTVASVEVAARDAIDEVPTASNRAHVAAKSARETGQHKGTFLVALAAASAADYAADRQMGFALHTIPAAVMRISESVPAVSGIIGDHVRRDFDHVARLAKWQHWTDDTPVPPEVFGPLWPEGPPKGWPVDPDTPQRTDLPLELLSRARVLEQMTEDEVVHLFNTVNAYYIARTGQRLTLEDLRPLVAATMLAEV